jgi:4a-hydroxytetrahydrobiopterin dehydratase
MSISQREQPLDEAAIAAALATLPDWERQGEAITKRFRFKGFKTAVDFINRVADVVNKINHHPDIHLEHYKHVRLVLSTKSAKAISQMDIDLARAIDAVETPPAST